MSDFEMLKIIALATPIAIFLALLVMLRIFIWQDDRDLRRREEERKLKAQP